MEIKTARLTLLIDPNKKRAFERLCAQQDQTASQVVRQMIRDYLVRHGVSYTPSGLVEDAPAAKAQRPRKPAAKVQAPAKAGKAGKAGKLGKVAKASKATSARAVSGKGRRPKVARA